MQIKMSVSYHVTETRTITIKHTHTHTNYKCWWKYGEGGILIRHQGECELVP